MQRSANIQHPQLDVQCAHCRQGDHLHIKTVDSQRTDYIRSATQSDNQTSQRYGRKVSRLGQAMDEQSSQNMMVMRSTHQMNCENLGRFKGAMQPGVHSMNEPALQPLLKQGVISPSTDDYYRINPTDSDLSQGRSKSQGSTTG